jgi:hypothetical protein
MGSSEKGEELLAVVFKKERLDGEEAINRDEWLLYTCHLYSYSFSIDWIL